MKTAKQILKDISLELDSHNPYAKGHDAGYGYWKEGAQFVLSKAQDELRKSEPSEMPEEFE